MPMTHEELARLDDLSARLARLEAVVRALPGHDEALAALEAADEARRRAKEEELARADAAREKRVELAWQLGLPSWLNGDGKRDADPPTDLVKQLGLRVKLADRRLVALAREQDRVLRALRFGGLHADRDREYLTGDGAVELHARVEAAREAAAEAERLYQEARAARAAEHKEWAEARQRELAAQ